jgi:hypothetical protein
MAGTRFHQHPLPTQVFECRHPDEGPVLAGYPPTNLLIWLAF